MRRNKFGIYLLYAAVLLAAVTAMSVGSTHARTSAGAVTVLDPQPTEEVSTGVLSADGSAVYLSDWYVPPEATVEPTAIPEPTPTPETETEPVPETEPTPTPEPTPSPPPTRRVTFTVPDETALTSEFSLSADGLLDPELEVENGTVTLTLRATDAVRSLTDRTYSTVTVFWNGLSADFQVPLITSPMDPASGASTELAEYTGNLLAFLAYGLPEDCRMRVTDIGGKPVSGLRFSVDGGQTWSLLYGAYECPLGLSGSGCVLLDFTDVTFRNGLRVTVDGAELLSETAALPDAGTDRTPAVLTGAGESYTVALDPAWLGCDLELGLYRLERTETGYEWLPADQPLPDVTLEQDTLTVSLPEEGDRIPAGSWRLTLAWTSGGTVMYETELRFFVLYTAVG